MISMPPRIQAASSLTIRIVAWSIVLVALVGGCRCTTPISGGDPCTDNSECPSGYVCYRNQCWPASSVPNDDGQDGGGLFMGDGDALSDWVYWGDCNVTPCPPGYICVPPLCQQACTSDAQCDSGHHCDLATGMCVPGTTVHEFSFSGAQGTVEDGQMKMKVQLAPDQPQGSMSDGTIRMTLEPAGPP
jgi:hypothetical protein